MYCTICNTYHAGVHNHYLPSPPSQLPAYEPVYDSQNNTIGYRISDTIIPAPGSLGPITSPCLVTEGLVHDRAGKLVGRLDPGGVLLPPQQQPE